VGPVKVDLLNVFMLFGAILTVVFENIVFNQSKTIQGTFFAQKVVLRKVNYGPCDVFILILNSAQISYLKRQYP
jgi:hypothetical protein